MQNCISFNVLCMLFMPDQDKVLNVLNNYFNILMFDEKNGKK